ncbi:transferrin-binding protein-like solute binding protein [Pasteurella sp. PK-2025]|uniref:transferrin-binding protein-like solute binding protein n=1 Tax=Pasteurella sp. PK-2025 TaxID=3413133 RepID=UPI003C783F2C
MKIAKLASLVISISVLAACGGGGGDGAGTAKTPDGDNINLTLSDKGTIAGKTRDGILLGQNNDYSFYGVWKNNAETLKELRYQGERATNIPDSGIATYKGDAVWLSGYDKGFSKGGVTTLNVDFGAKTIEGNIKFSVFNGDEFRRDITLHKGGLSGAEFSGKASVVGNDSGRYEGALFGKDAKEAAGLVQFEKANSLGMDLDVSFGGKKQ